MKWVMWLATEVALQAERTARTKPWGGCVLGGFKEQYVHWTLTSLVVARCCLKEAFCIPVTFGTFKESRMFKSLWHRNTLWIFLSAYSMRPCTMLFNHGNLPSGSTSGDCWSTTLWKCCTTPCFYWKEEVGVGTGTSGPVQGKPAEDTHRGTGTLSGSSRLRVPTGENVHVNSLNLLVAPVSCLDLWCVPQWANSTLCWLSSVLPFGEMVEGQKRNIEICLDGVSPQVGGGRQGRGDFQGPG